MAAIPVDAIPDPSCVDGANLAYTPWRTFYATGESLLWWARSPAKGIAEGTINNGARIGARFSAGCWFDEHRCFGLDANYLFLTRDTAQVTGPTSTYLFGTELWGGEVNFRTNLQWGPTCFVDLLVGWRTLTLEEEFIALPNNSTLAQSQTRNRFDGGQVGLAGEQLLFPRLSLNWSAKVALGSTSQRISPQSPITQRSFSIVPEVQVNLGYQLCPNVRTFVGYNFLYWSNVARASEQSAGFHYSGYWAQGMTSGLEFRW